MDIEVRIKHTDLRDAVRDMPYAAFSLPLGGLRLGSGKLRSAFRTLTVCVVAWINAATLVWNFCPKGK